MKLWKGKGEKTENKRIHLFIVPIIVALMLICVITIIFVGAHSVRPTETAELNKDVEQQEEHISAATDIAATSIGTNVGARFEASTGEIYIYSNSATTSTIDKSKWYTFLKKIIKQDNSLDAVKTINFTSLIYAPKDSSNLFCLETSSEYYNFKRLENIVGLDYLETSKVTNMSSMFNGCSRLTILRGTRRIDGDKNLYWNTENVTDMSNMFSYCDSLTEIYCEDWNTGKVTNMSNMFRNCKDLSRLNLKSWNVENVETMNGMFYGCSSLTSLDFSSWKAKKVSNMSGMFWNCLELETCIMDVGSFNSLEDANKMFYNCKKLIEFTDCLGCSDVTGNVGLINTESMFEDCICLKTVKIRHLKGNRLIRMFNSCQSLEKVVFEGKKVERNETLYLGLMFYGCSKLSFVDFRGLDGSGMWDFVYGGNYSTGSNAFNSCFAVKELYYPKLKLRVRGGSENSGERMADFVSPGGAAWVDVSVYPRVTYQHAGRWTCDLSKGEDPRELHLKKLVNYKIDYNLDGGIASGNKSTYNISNNAFSLVAPTKNGYRFLGWTGSNGTNPQLSVTIDPLATSENLTYTANWQAESATYQVRHWKQNINGNANTHDANNYTLADTENKTGSIGTNVTPPVKTTYTGFNSPGTQTKAISASGTVIDYWYTRKSFTVTLTKGTGIASVSGANTYVYGANVTIDAVVSDGYTWLDWTGSQKTTTKRLNFTMSAGNVTYTANATPNTNTKYIVRHWQQKVNGNAGTHDTNNYTLVDTENKTGTTGANVTPAVKSATEYVGFIPPGTQTKQVAGNGNMVVDYYYPRQTYEVKLNKGTGIDTVTGGGSYVYGANVTINATLLSGYSWKNWTGTHTVTSQSHSFTMPAGNVIDTANATIDTYRITYNLNGGEVNENPESYTAETVSFTLVNPTKAGYTFTGWTGTNGETAQENVTISKGSIGDRNYIANWVANTDTPYMVRHWKQNIDGKAEQQNEYNYTIAERKNLTGTTDTSVTPKINTYEGFTSPTVQTKTITGDGNLIIDYYYTRNKYTVTLNKGKGVAAVLGEGEYAYGDEVTINVMVLAGYDWVKWSGENESRDLKVTFTMPAKNVEYTTVTMPNPNTKYTIKHWKQKLEGKVDEYNEENYELVDTDELTGETDSRVSPETKDYEGFKKPDADGISVPITGEGTLVIDYFYKRNSYEVKLNKGKGIKEIQITGNITGEGKDRYLYEEEVTIKAILEPGYTWDKWIVGAPFVGIPEGSDTTVPDIVHTFTIGLEDVEYTANAIPNTDTLYKVQHWQQKLTGNADIHDETNYDLIDTDADLTGTTDEEITPGTKEYAGFTAPQTQTVRILGDGSLEVNYYYTRNTNTPYKVEHWQENLPADNTETEEITNLDNYTLVDTEELTGTTGATVTPETKEYAGFTAPQTQAVEILGDGSLVIKYYYTRNTNTPYVVKHWKENLPTENTETGENTNLDNYTLADTDELTGTTGATVTPNVKEYAGFTAPKAQTVEILADGSLEVNYYYTRNTNTPYKVQHWQQKLTGNAETHDETNYTQIDTDELTGTTGATVTPNVKEYDGYISPETKEIIITADGSSVLSYYYTRRNDLTCTVKHIDKGTQKTIFTRTIKELKYEEEVNATEEIMEIEDYTYESMEPETLKIGTVENLIKIYYTKQEGTIIVHHYIYDEKENKYTEDKLVEDEEKTGKIGEQYTTTKSSKIPENYECIDETPENYTGIIEGGTKEITYYYKLKTPKVDTEVGGETTEGGNQREDGKWEIKAGEEIKYKISYKTKIEEYKGKVKIEVKAELPKGTKIEEGKCDFAGGTYDKATNTITWTKEIEEINTFKNGTYTDGIEKEITIIYAEDYILDEIEPKVTGKTILYYPDGNTGEEDKPLIEDETDGTGKVIIHHYIYDEKTDTYTETKLVEDEEIVKKVGEEYISKKSKEIPENYVCINEKPEGHKGKIEKGTKEISYYYKLKEPTIDTSTGGEWAEGGNQTEDGKWEIKAGEEIKYKIKYKTEIEDYKGKATIEIKAELPEGTRIDQEKCDFAEGTYDEETNTIKWTKEIEGIDTFENGNYIEEIEKEITIVYAEDYVLDEITPKVTGKTILYYPDGYPGGGTEGGEQPPLVEDETDGYGKVIIYHYIYDEKTNTYTTQKLVENEQIKGEIGKEYETKPSDKIPANYECINGQPEGYKGKYTKETIKINYYYKLKTPTIEGETGGEVVEGGEQTEDGKWEIKAGEEIKYKISYKTKIEDYKGKVRIEITAKLPEGTGIDERKCNLAGGTYDKETNTITWVKEIEEIDTFIDGEYTEEIEKEITIVYDNDYILDDIGLKVKGKTILYYPDDYPIEGDGTLKEDETEKKEKGKIVVHHYIYDKEDNKYTETKLVEDEEIEKEIGENYETKPSEKVPLNYECINEKPEGHTGIIEKGTKEISYYYKLKTPKTAGNGNSNIITDIEKDEEGNYIIKAGREIEYEIKYEAKIEDYKGKATVEIKAELPEGTKIEQDKCDFDGGIYDEVTNTITWVKEIENIDTFANGQYTETITKNIKIVYAEDYVLKDANLKVTGNIKTYYPDDYPDKGGETLPKEDDPNNPEEKMGKVIVRYVDIETEEGAYEYEITGKIGEAYETEEKEIKYYVLVRSEGNTKGEIKEEEQIVTYYYRKLNFNIGIEKTIGTITLNGKNIKIGNKETSKLEIKKEDIKNTEIIVKYNIKVTNTGELRGTSKIVEQIPEGYELAYLPEYWKVMRDETLETNVDLEAGQSKELEVVLRWENKENNLGAKTNIAKIEETKNEANFKDTNEEDNVGKATIVLSIKTGEAVSSIIIVMIMGTLIISSYITIVTIRRKDPEIKDIKFLK